nr:MAG TPA: hypothetical protein [Caudoviricetes sp.]
MRKGNLRKESSKKAPWIAVERRLKIYLYINYITWLEFYKDRKEIVWLKSITK